MALHRKNSKTGLSLIEVMVAMFLIAVALASTLPILYRMIRYTRAMKLRSKAIYLADRQMEKIRSWPLYEKGPALAAGVPAEYGGYITTRNGAFWDCELFAKPDDQSRCFNLQWCGDRTYCYEQLIPQDVGVPFERTTWIVRNGGGSYDDPTHQAYNCSPVLFGAATGDFQQAPSANKLINEGPIYLSDGSQFSNTPLTNDGITGACSTASLNAWASYRWAGKRRFVRYDSSCGGSYPYRGEDFVLLEVDIAWTTRIAGHARAQAVEREITRSTIIRGR